MEKTRVLIVDDEQQITTMLRRLLERTGRYEVRVENHSPDALAVARDFLPEVMVLDVCMPDMDGPEVAQAMQAVPELARVPLFFLTGLAGPDEIGPQGWEAGERVYLPKPIKMADFLHRLELATA